MDSWKAPTAPSPVHATVAVPGSKSQTNRALVLAALATAQGTSTISGALRSRDTDLMIGAVRALGVTVEGDDSELAVSGPCPCRCLAAARKDADEHQRDNDLHEDERDEKDRTAGQILLRPGNVRRKDRQVRQVADRDEREQAAPPSIGVPTERSVNQFDAERDHGSRRV